MRPPRTIFSWSSIEPPWDYDVPWPGRVAVRWGITIAGLAAADFLIDGVAIDGLGALLGAAAIFVVARAVLRPLLIFITCPLQLLTLGLFLFVVNAIILGVTSWASGELGIAFQVNDFGAAFFGAFVISSVSFLFDRLLRARARNARDY